MTLTKQKLRYLIRDLKKRDRWEQMNKARINKHELYTMQLNILETKLKRLDKELKWKLQ